MPCRCSFLHIHNKAIMQAKIFDNAAQRAAWIAQSYTRLVTYCILHNPRGTYMVIKAKYPEFAPWGLGAEQTPANQEALYQFIIQKAQNSGDAARFVTELTKVVPRNPSQDNLWLKNS
jgi:hypothetical protein